MNSLEKALLKTISNIETNKKKIVKNARKLKKCENCGHWYSGEHKKYCKIIN